MNFYYIGPEFQRKAFQNCFRWEIVFLVRLKISISKTRKTHYLNMFRIFTRLDMLLTILNFRAYHAVPFFLYNTNALVLMKSRDKFTNISKYNVIPVLKMYLTHAWSLQRLWWNFWRWKFLSPGPFPGKIFPSHPYKCFPSRLLMSRVHH